MTNKLRDKWKRLDTRIQDFIVVSPLLILIFLNSTNSSKSISPTSSQVSILFLLPIVFIELVVYWGMFKKLFFGEELEPDLPESDRNYLESQLKVAISYFQKMDDSYRFLALIDPHKFKVLIETEKFPEKGRYTNKKHALKNIKKILNRKKNSSNENYSEYREKDSFISIVLIKQHSLAIVFYTTISWVNLDADDIETEERFFKNRLTSAKKEVYDVIFNKYI